MGNGSLDSCHVDLLKHARSPCLRAVPASFPAKQERSQYLNTGHQFRHKLLNVPRRGIVGELHSRRPDGEAFLPPAGYRSVGTMVGSANIAQPRTWHTNE